MFFSTTEALSQFLQTATAGDVFSLKRMKRGDEWGLVQTAVGPILPPPGVIDLTADVGDDAAAAAAAEEDASNSTSAAPPPALPHFDEMHVTLAQGYPTHTRQRVTHSMRLVEEEDGNHHNTDTDSDKEDEASAIEPSITQSVIQSDSSDDSVDYELSQDMAYMAEIMSPPEKK